MVGYADIEDCVICSNSESELSIVHRVTPEHLRC